MKDRDIGVRELKIHASEIIRKVKEKRAQYVITHRGRPVAILTPVEEVQPAENPESSSAWDELIRLGKEIGQGWQPTQTSTEILSEMRR